MGKDKGRLLMEQRAIWLGFCLPDNIAKMLYELDPLPAVQTQKFGWSFARALNNVFEDVSLASSFPVQSYPIVRRLVFRGVSFSYNEMNGVSLGFINVVFLKHLTRMMSCLINVFPMLRHGNSGWLFIHGVHSPYLLFGIFARFFGWRVLVVLTDPPGMILESDSRLSKLLKKIDACFVGRLLSCMDGVIALAPELARRLAPGLPAISFPGILDRALEKFKFSKLAKKAVKYNSLPFTIVYAGALNKAYGIDLLIDAVVGFEKNINICLKLFGRGDQEDRVRTLAVSDKRFFYGGFLDNSNLLPELFQADVLINPRPTAELFVSLSFPSKLIEYLYAGQSVLTTRVPSIPDAIKNLFYYIDIETADGIRSAIDGVMKVPSSERQERAKLARDSVLSEFSEDATGQKILNFVHGLE